MRAKNSGQIGKNLQKLRKMRGFRSAKEFAEFAQISLNTYTGYEQGRIALTYERAWRIADALDCTLDEIGGRVPPARNLHNDERVLIDNFRTCTRERQKNVINNVMDNAQLSASEKKTVQNNKVA